MNNWYYRHGHRTIGPVEKDVLENLSRTGVINANTAVKRSPNGQWKPLRNALGDALGNGGATQPQGSSELMTHATRFYYLDDRRQPVGPFDLASLRRLLGKGTLEPDTLVSGIGDSQWVPASSLLGLAERPGYPFTNSTASDQYPRFRSLEEFARLMGITLGLYVVYLVPCQSRDIKAITGRERMEFTALMILGMVTFTLLLGVMTVLWAFDLERHGKAINKTGRQESLGTIVLVLTVLGVVLGFAISEFIVAAIVNGVLYAAAVWFVQKEINLYATRPEPALR